MPYTRKLSDVSAKKLKKTILERYMSGGVKDGKEYEEMGKLMLEETDIRDLLNSMTFDDSNMEDEFEIAQQKASGLIHETDVDRFMKKIKYCKIKDSEQINVLDFYKAVCTGHFPNKLDDQKSAELFDLLKGLQEMEDFDEKKRCANLLAYDDNVQYHKKEHNDQFKFPFEGEGAMTEEEYFFMIAMAQNTNRPYDMLMFLGRYFWNHLVAINKVTQENKKLKHNEPKNEISSFYFTPQMFNFLANANKMITDNARQELRISIALTRNPQLVEAPTIDELISRIDQLFASNYKETEQYRDVQAARLELENRIDKAPISERDQDRLRIILEETMEKDRYIGLRAVSNYVTLIDNVAKTPEVLHNNVVNAQLDIIQKSAKIYNFVDFLQDARNFLGAKKSLL